MSENKTTYKLRKKYAQELTDKQWQALLPLLPKSKKKAGKAVRFPLDSRSEESAFRVNRRAYSLC
jgi:transposase